jgi:hypothetical protein
LLFWQDVCNEPVGRAATLASFLNLLRPQMLVIINSQRGLDAVAQYGLPLSRQMRIYCVYFAPG